MTMFTLPKLVLTNILSSRQIKLNQTIYLCSKKQFNTNTCLGSMCEDEICIKNQKCKKTNKDLVNSSDSDDDSLMGFGYDLNGNFGYGLKLGGFRNHTNVANVNLGNLVDPLVSTIDCVNTTISKSDISTNTSDISTDSFVNSENVFDESITSVGDTITSVGDTITSVGDTITSVVNTITSISD